MPKDKISVTVIIPAYSKPELLLETLRSVYSQKGNYSIKIIVVDDCSPEPLGPIIKKSLPQVKVIRNRKNLKSGPARNQALNFINTDFVVFLDADDIWKKDFLRQSIKNISKGNYVGSVAMSSPLFDKDMPAGFKIKIYILSAIRDIFQLLFYLFHRKTMPRSAFYLCQLSHEVFRADKIKELKFDSNYNFGGEDWKFALEVMDRGMLVIVPKRLVRYRYHKKSTSLKDSYLKNKWNSYRQLFGELKKRKINGIMVWLFGKYIDTFKDS
ncbi:glycosyltransferase family 2 protein [Patescibacteria group bacterium]|nr:glycosyltransferase family 2 protein [Patescibacteria group bacterium]